MFFSCFNTDDSRLTVRPRDGEVLFRFQIMTEKSAKDARIAKHVTINHRLRYIPTDPRREPTDCSFHSADSELLSHTFCKVINEFQGSCIIMGLAKS